MRHPTSRTLFAYWNALRGGRASPECRDIAPAAISRILADTFILENGPGQRARVRLAGTRLCALFGRELKGEPFERLFAGPGAAEVRRLLDVVLGETIGLVAGCAAATDDGTVRPLEMLLLPLRHDGRTDARILGALSGPATPAWAASPAISRLGLVSLRMIRPRDGRPEIARRPAGQPRLVVHTGGRA